MRRAAILKFLAVGFAIVHAIRVKHGKSVPLSLASVLANYFARKSYLGILAGDLLGFLFLAAVYRSLRRVLSASLHDNKNALIDWFYGSIKDLPFVAPMIEKEMAKQEKGLEKSIIPEGMESIAVLPEEGLTPEQITQTLERYVSNEKGKWEEGKVSGAVYHGGEEHVNIMNTASSLYSITNPLHTDIWPSLRQMESDVCKMTASLMKGTCPTVVGSFTSGGTESIVLAARAHFNRGLAKGITHPEIIASNTAHAAIYKACEMFGIHLILVKPNPKTLQMDVDATRRAISSDTIMIYSSAPNFPNGIVDPLSDLSKLAVKYDVGLHVDCCLGGFILPFAKKLGHPVPEFDFSLPGVTSMSVDTHKYGYAAKGSSVVLYRTKQLRRQQYFTYPKWTGGLYCTATIAGSRPGSIVAATWASLMHMGMKGYMDATRDILETTKEIIAGIREIPEISLIGSPGLMIAAFGSKTLNIYQINDSMSHKGWALNALQNPASIHLCVTLRQVGRAEKFLGALRESIHDVKSNPNSQGEASGSAPIYGTVGSLPPGPVKEVMSRYIDVTLS